MTKITYTFFTIISISGIYSSCKKTENISISKSLLVPTAGVRYKDEVFTNVDTSQYFNHTYRISSFNGTNYELKLDAYFPSGDTATKRPAIVHIHGGGFTGGTRKMDSLYLRSLAKRGFVAISIDYRLGIIWPNSTNRFDSISRFLEAAYRATQDARAAIRYIRKYSSFASIDTNKIFLSGNSAGAATALTVAYLEQNEIPAEWWIPQGPLDSSGIYDYPGYSTKVAAVVNMEAPISDTNYIDAGDPPIVSLVGTSDQFYYGNVHTTSPTYVFFNIPAIHQRAINLGIPQAAKYYPGGIHGSTGGANLNTTINFITDKIYPLSAY